MSFLIPPQTCLASSSRALRTLSTTSRGPSKPTPRTARPPPLNASRPPPRSASRPPSPNSFRPSPTSSSRTSSSARSTSGSSPSASGSSSQIATKLLPHEKRRSQPVLPRLEPEIVYEDAKLVILNKRSGVAMQGQHGSTARRLWEMVLEDLKARKESPEVFPVHRLDKSTTGCLVLAKSSVQAKKLSKQFAAHEIQRSYLGIVHGSIKKGFVGEVETRLRVDDDCVRKAEGESGMAASTKWQCLSSSGSHSLLHLEPGTGRKHQLRVHCAETLKAPLVGDFKYGPDAHHRALLGFAPDTILLHSLTTSFWTWDKSGKRSTIIARAEPPAVFKQFCEVAGLELKAPPQVAKGEQAITI